MSIADLDADITAVKKGLRDAGVPTKLVNAVATRALRSGWRQTGEFQSNRESRWNLKKRDPQYGTESNCKKILLRLYATLLEYEGAPLVGPATQEILETRLGRKLVPTASATS